MDNQDQNLSMALAFSPPVNDINHLRRTIAELALREGGTSSILRELEATSWDEWIAEARVRKTSKTLIVLCSICNHNMPYTPEYLHGMKFCARCLQLGSERWKQHMHTSQSCSTCGGAHSPSELIEVSIPYRPGGNGKKIKNVCPVTPELELESFKLTCMACDVRYLPFHSEHLCDVCWSGSVRREWARVHSHNTRARALNKPATLTIKQWLFTLEHFNHKCAYCQNKPHSALEHYMPLPHGGTSADNCLPSCTSCNLRKGPKHPDDFTALFPAENIARIRSWLENQRITPTI